MVKKNNITYFESIFHSIFIFSVIFFLLYIFQDCLTNGVNVKIWFLFSLSILS